MFLATGLGAFVVLVLWLWVLFGYGCLGLMLLLDGAVRWLRLPCWFCLRYFLLVGFVCILYFVAGSGLFRLPWWVLVLVLVVDLFVGGLNFVLAFGC